MKNLFAILLLFSLVCGGSYITPAHATAVKRIALTFDDGPNPYYTPQLLDVLDQYNAPSTFFVIGKNVEKYPEIVREEELEGHEIENHSYSHAFLNHLPPDKIRDEIEKTQSTIISITGQHPHLFRPPGGFYNNEIADVVRAEGYRVVMWSWYQDTKDWKKPGVDKIVQTVLNNAHDKDIVLFHDSFGRDCSQTIAALKQIIPTLQSRGFQFVTVSELMKK